MITPEKRRYNYVHKWHLRYWYKAGVCEHCSKETKTEWADKTRMCSLKDRTQWLELCRPCHLAYDRADTRQKIAATRTRHREYKKEALSSGLLWGTLAECRTRLVGYQWYKP